MLDLHTLSGQAAVKLVAGDHTNGGNAMRFAMCFSPASLFDCVFRFSLAASLCAACSAQNGGCLFAVT